METKKLLKSLKRRLGLITAILAMLAVSQEIFAWGWAARDTKNQDLNPTVYVGSTITFSWCVNGDGNGASYKRVGISTSSSSFGTSYDPGYAKCTNCDCEGSGNNRYQYTYTATSAGTKYYSLWLGWGSSVGDNGRYYNGGGWSDGMTSCSGTSFTVKAVPAPKSCSIEVTNAASGTGTQADPYIVRPGASYTVKVTATKADDFTGSGYAFNINTTSSKTGAGTTASYSKDYTAGSAGTSAEYTGYAWHYNGSTSYYSSTYATSSKIYVSVKAACPDVTQADITGDATMYVGDNKTYTASATGGTITSYAWTVPSGLSGTSTSSTICITATGSGSKTLKAKATNDCGNTGTDGSKSITVSALPSVTNQNATAVSNSQINLTWKHNANKTTVMVVRYLSSASITDPTQGQEYNTTDKKTIGAGTVIYKGTDESFQSTGLTAATSYTYYFYTVNNNYYSSGVNYNATTHSACVPPTSVTTADASNIKSTSATLGGSYSGGSGTPTEVGIEWEGSHIQEAAKTVASTFTVDVKDLSANNEYTYRAYAKACETTVYGDVKTLTTCAVPVMAQATRVTTDYSTDYLKYNVKASSLGCAVTEWGLNVYTDNNCTQLLKPVQGSGDLATTNKVVTVDGLNANTAYYVKAYAKYDGGSSTTEGTKTGWQTKVAIGDASATSVTNNSATLNSTTGAGGSAATGFSALFRYSTNESAIAGGATIQGSATAAGQAITANLSGLSAGTTYYYRVEIAYKEAGSGNTVTLVGATKSFTTLNVHGDITGLPASPLAKCSADEPLQLAPQCSTATSWGYSSSNPSVASVSAEGLITFNGAGNTTITVTAKATGYADKQAQFTINVAANPTLTLSGSGAKSASATYPWEYMTITATAEAGSELTWNDLVAPAGVNYVYETGSADNVKQLKSEQTANPNTDKFTVSATATKSGCSTTKTYDVYINAAPAEQCQ